MTKMEIVAIRKKPTGMESGESPRYGFLELLKNKSQEMAQKKEPEI